jgi:predicted AAA+ superfamily ATPase
VKTPRVYWRDTGLLHALLRTSNYDDLLGQPWVGASWEGFVIEQVIGALQQADKRAAPYFFRTSDGLEIDLLLDMGQEKWAIEIKLTSHPSRDDLDRLSRAADLVQASKRVLLTQTTEAAIGEDRVSCNLPTLLELLRR